MNILDLNKLASARKSKTRYLCSLLSSAILKESEGFRWNNTDHLVHTIENPEANLFPLIDKRLLSHIVEGITQEAKSLACVDNAASVGQFTILVGDHQATVTVTTSITDSTESIELRLGDTSHCQEAARSLASDYIELIKSTTLVLDYHTGDFIKRVRIGTQSEQINYLKYTIVTTLFFIVSFLLIYFIFYW